MDPVDRGTLEITFSNGECVRLANPDVRAFATKYLDSPEHVPDSVRRAVEFQRCSVCPHRNEPGYCQALFPSLAVFDAFDRYPSYEPVTVSYGDLEHDGVITRSSSLQKAMLGVAMLSLLDYCEYGRAYRDFFLHVNPLMKLPGIVSRIYLNAYWLSRGDADATARKLRAFTRGLQTTIDCQLKRMRLISKNDAFLNTFVAAHVLTELLDHDMQGAVDTALAQHQQFAVTDLR